jgi:hypothetical protein
MSVCGLARWVAFIVAAIAASAVAAGEVKVPFPDYSGTEMNAGFPAAPVTICPVQDPTCLGQPTDLDLPAGEAVISGTISGSWGNTGAAGKGTAGVALYLDDLLVAQCLSTDVTCYCPDSAACAGAVSWSFPLTSAQIAALNTSGVVKLTAIQTSPKFVRLGETMLTLTTAPIVPPIPALSRRALVVLLLSMAMIGLIAVRRRQAARR